jgi:hypothetical protein
VTFPSRKDLRWQIAQTIAHNRRDHAQQLFWTSCGEASFAARNSERENERRATAHRKTNCPVK